ncbi:MAG: protein-export chaperone SecB [Rickettsiales bacterium]|jgi:preprotein translocase subunit SecB|nr:protein-export chaperone SecB [Rickettsiales bacterium]
MNSINIINQYIKDLSIELPHSPQIFLEQSGKPNINISIDIDAKKLINNEKEEDKKIFEVILKISAEAETTTIQSGDNSKQEAKKLFILEISYAGLFQINEENTEIIEQILLIYCPNLLFPFLRRIASNIVGDAGLPPLMLEPIDFNELYNRRSKQAKEEDKKIN